MKPDVWLVLGVNNVDNKIRMIGPHGFDIVNMLGMIEYAKLSMEPSDDK